jgi:hypothetical protein
MSSSTMNKYDFLEDRVIWRAEQRGEEWPIVLRDGEWLI